MSIRRYLHRTVTFVPRLWHRRGFGVQSPSDYKLVKDVLFESLAYYAYQDQNLKTSKEKQLYRLRLFYGDRLVVGDKDAVNIYRQITSGSDDSKAFVIENISKRNSILWSKILVDPKARVTYDMGNRGLVLFDRKRIKQNYLL